MRVRWTEPAASDLTHICDYVEEHDSTTTPRRVAILIHDERVSVLVKFPELGRTGRKPSTRELRGEAVEILRILHGAQDWSP